MKPCQVPPEHDALGRAIAAIAEDSHTHPVVRRGAPAVVSLHKLKSSLKYWYRWVSLLTVLNTTHPNQLFM